MVADAYVLTVPAGQLAWIYAIFCVIGAVVATAVLRKFRVGGAKALVGVWVAAAVIATVLVTSGIAPTSAVIRVDRQTLSISAPLNPSVTVSRSDVAWVKIVNLSEKAGLQPSMKLLGTSIPGGLQLGWFRLNNGAKAYVLSTGGTLEAVVIKLKNGSYVEISLPKAELAKLVSALRQYSWMG